MRLQTLIQLHRLVRGIDAAIQEEIEHEKQAVAEEKDRQKRQTFISKAEFDRIMGQSTVKY